MTTRAVATWPDAAPLPGEELIFSISCGNSFLHWATHFGVAKDYNPEMFWRTPHVTEEDLVNDGAAAILSRNLPDYPHDYIFGKISDATTAAADIQSKKRNTPKISVYVVSTNQVQEELLERIWKAVPSRFFIIGGDDFFTEEEGRYDTMGTDRLATLTGAAYLYGHPALVFDGGTAMTYSATDSNGQILGGGIGPGIQSKLRSLAKDTDALPQISSEQIITRVKEAQEKGNSLPIFARNTQEAIMADTLQEFALKGRNVIQHWLSKAYVKSNKSPFSGEIKSNTEKRILCTGGDGDVLMQLLQPHYGGVIEHVAESHRSESNGELSRSDQYTVEWSKHLIHYGIAYVLVHRGCSNSCHLSLNEHVGKRIAKYFDVEADDGDNIFRGTVIEAIEDEGSEPYFHVRYDDGDSEDVAIDELFDMFTLFAHHGEKLSKQKANKNKGTQHVKVRGTRNNLTDNSNSTANISDETKSKKRKEIDEDTVNISRPTVDNQTRTPDGSKQHDQKKFAMGYSGNITELVNTSDPTNFVRKRIAKDFNGKTFFGTISKYDDSDYPAFWHIMYDDGDDEDYNKKDLIKALKHYSVKGKYDPKHNK